jgi:hypothetical protein
VSFRISIRRVFTLAEAVNKCFPDSRIRVLSIEFEDISGEFVDNRGNIDEILLSPVFRALPEADVRGKCAPFLRPDQTL